MPTPSLTTASLRRDPPTARLPLRIVLGLSAAALAAFVLHTLSPAQTEEAALQPPTLPVAPDSDPSRPLAMLTAAIAWDTLPVDDDPGASIAAYGE